jgi:hypothetical protein
LIQALVTRSAYSLKPGSGEERFRSRLPTGFLNPSGIAFLNLQATF